MPGLAIGLARLNALAIEPLRTRVCASALRRAAQGQATPVAGEIAQAAPLRVMNYV